jgi:hypothetical protein
MAEKVKFPSYSSMLICLNAVRFIFGEFVMSYTLSNDYG